MLNPDTSNPAKTFLSRVKWDPVRYSDNVGVQFLIELQKVAKERGNNGESEINTFLDRMSRSADLYREPFSENEIIALQRIAERCHLKQQLSDSALVGNVYKSVVSRRGVIGGIGGLIAGNLVSSAVGSVNPKNDPRIRASIDEREQLNTVGANIQQRMDDIEPTLSKSSADRTPQEQQEIDELQKDTEDYARAVRLQSGHAQAAFEPYKIIVENMPTILPVIGGGLGVYAATAGEGQKQAGLKFEAFVKQMDGLIEYRLGRSPIARDGFVR